MKKLLLATGVFVLGMFSIQAQESNKMPPAEERAQSQTEMMKEKLDLADEQIPEVYEINLSSAKQMDEIVQITDRATKIKKYRSAQQKKDKGFKAILTKDQYKNYEKMKDEMKKKSKEQRKNSN